MPVIIDREYERALGDLGLFKMLTSPNVCEFVLIDKMPDVTPASKKFAIPCGCLSKSHEYVMCYSPSRPRKFTLVQRLSAKERKGLAFLKKVLLGIKPPTCAGLSLSLKQSWVLHKHLSDFNMYSAIKKINEE